MLQVQTYSALRPCGELLGPSTTATTAAPPACAKQNARSAKAAMLEFLSLHMLSKRLIGPFWQGPSSSHAVPGYPTRVITSLTDHQCNPFVCRHEPPVRVAKGRALCQ